MFCIWAIMATWLVRSGRLNPFLAAVTWSPSKLGGALLELREVLDGSQRALGAVDQLIEDPAQAHRVDAEARRLRAIVWVLVEGGVGDVVMRVPVLVTAVAARAPRPPAASARKRNAPARRPPSSAGAVHSWMFSGVLPLWNCHRGERRYAADISGRRRKARPAP